MSAASRVAATCKNGDAAATPPTKRSEPASSSAANLPFPAAPSSPRKRN